MTLVAAPSDQIAPPGRESIAIGQIVLKVASACNLDCSYCYVYHGKDQSYRTRPGILSDEILNALLARAGEYCAESPGRRLSICLHGGEPLLLGRERFRAVVERIRAESRDWLGSLHVQTNAVLVDREWARLLKALGVSVSVSLDGPPSVNDVARVDHMGRGTGARTAAGIGHLLREGLRVSVLCVVTPGHSGAETYRYLRSLGVTSFDFLLPDVTHDDREAAYGAFGPTPVADSLAPALDAWLAEDDPEVDIRFFSDMFRLILGDVAGTDAFGGGPMPYVIVETDGAIEANDALRVCEEGLNRTGLNVLRDGLGDVFRQLSLTRDLFAGDVPKPRACRSCPEFDICGGGYMPHRYSKARLFDNPSVWCADILKLFSSMRAVAARSQ